MKPAFRLFPHTSEAGLEITAPDWASFYRTAAEGLLAVYGLKPGRQAGKKTSRSFAAETPEDLLVAWLSELIFLIYTKGLVPARISVIDAGPHALSVGLSLQRFHRTDLAREIKAVTYHGLKVIKRRSGLTARVILDV
jgi:SHS2 domain-containing protein